jgi:hypothetical protein
MKLSVGSMISLPMVTGEGKGPHPRFCNRVFFQEAFIPKFAAAALKSERYLVVSALGGRKRVVSSA